MGLTIGAGVIIEQGITLGSITPAPAPLMYLDADNSSSYSGSGLTVFDLSGNGYTNSLADNINFPQYIATFQNVGGIKYFDMLPSGVNIPFGAGPILGSNYSMLTWANLRADNFAAGRTLGQMNNYNNRMIFINTNTNTLGALKTNESTSQDEFFSTGYDVGAFVNTWALWAVVGNNSTQTFYINGQQVGSTINAGFSGGQYWGWTTVLIPFYPYIGTQFGYGASIWLYDSQLTQSQILANYTANRSKFGV